MEQLLFQITVAALAVVGFAIAYTIHRHKKHAKPLVCPIGGGCSLVTESEHSRFAGMHNEDLGMFYYAGVAALYFIVALTNPSEVYRPVYYAMIIIPTVAFLFSAYLVYLQARVIKEWCTWCLGSAVVSTLIFILALAAMPAGLW